MDEQDAQDITEGGFSNPPIRRGEACLAHLTFTPTALDSTAQRRAAHAGLPIIHMIEPQRGSTNNFYLWDWPDVEPRWGSPFTVLSTQCALRDTGLWS